MKMETQPFHHPPDGVGIVLVAGPTPGRWHNMAEGFRSLDELGCGAIWLTDHLFWGQPMPEALTTSAMAAANTQRCWVGTGVLQLPMRNPAAVAKAAATISLASQGRFILGVGSGEHRREFEFAGADFDGRGSALDDSIKTLRELWSPQDPDPIYQQLPRPGAIPLWVGGRSARARRRAASGGDGWFPMFVTLDQFQAGCHALDDDLATAGRDPDSVHRAVVILAAVDETAGGRTSALGWCGRLWGISPERLGPYLITGGPSRVAETISSYHNAGAEHISLLLATDEPLVQMEQLMSYMSR